MLDAEFYRKQCARLREENEELLEENINLRKRCETFAQLCNDPQLKISRTLGLAPSASRLLCKLLDASPRLVTNEGLLIHVGSRRGGDELIKVYVSRVRAALRLNNIAANIENFRGEGYRISLADAHVIRRFFAGDRRWEDAA